MSINRANTKKTLLEEVIGTEISIEISDEENYQELEHGADIQTA